MSEQNKAIVKQCNASVVAPSVAPSVIARLADRFGVDQSKMLSASSPRRSVAGARTSSSWRCASCLSSTA